VRVTGTRECIEGQKYTVVYVYYKDYVKGVLPNEWLPSWDQEALRAGAIAVKQFGVLDYLDSGYVWDCNWDQVYDPSRRTEATDRAVEDTWDTWLIDEGGLVNTIYNADKAGCYDRGECLPQWESQRLARQGWLARDILGKYYSFNLLRLENLTPLHDHRVE
jgi:peptidoglycan hydrolase-like amidase